MHAELHELKTMLRYEATRLDHEEKEQVQELEEVVRRTEMAESDSK